jgi:hypothetical protein
MLAAVGESQITPDQAAKLLQGLGAQARVVEIDSLAQRVAALEETVSVVAQLKTKAGVGCGAAGPSAPGRAPWSL